MADSIQKQVLDALKTRLELIRIANGYATDVEEVEIAARSPGEPEVGRALRWIGIIPQNNPVTEQPGRLEYNWAVNLVCHQVIASRTAEAVNKACTDIENDIRRALIGTDTTLGVDGVIMTSVVNSESSIAHPQAQIEAMCTSSIDIIIKYEVGVWSS